MRIEELAKVTDVTETIHPDRRRFLRTGAMTIAAAHIGGFGQSGSESTCATGVGGHRQCGGVAQFPTPDVVESCRESRARGLLDLHLHQLAAHAPLCSRVGAEVPRAARRDRRPHTRVRVRTEHRQRPSRGAADADRISRRDRQRLRHLACVQQPILAGPLLHRCARTRSRASVRRGRVPTVGDGHSAVARRSGCRRRREGVVSVAGERRRSRGGLGATCGRRKPTSATTGSRTSRRAAAPTRIGVASMRRPRGWHSISGRWRASGRWAGRRPSSAAPTGGSSTAFMRATCISSWGRHGRSPRCVFACRSTGSRQAPPTAWTSTRAATAWWSNSGCISWSGSRSQSSIERSRSSSSMPGVEAFAFTFG